MAPRARMAQERSRQRREQLIAAAITVFADGGSRSVTHRAVADLAGLPRATTTYYFESIDQLLREALVHRMGIWTDNMSNALNLRASMEQARDPKEVAAVVATILASYPAPAMARDVNILSAAMADPELRPLAENTMKAFEQIVATTLASTGLDPEKSALVARQVVMACLGMALRRSSHSSDDDLLAVELGVLIASAIVSAVARPDLAG